MPNTEGDVRVGDSVWDENLGNGTVTDIAHEWAVAYCHFHHKNVDAEINLESFVGNFDERLNQWVILPVI